MGRAVLFCASTASHINNFHLPYINSFVQSGFTVDTLCQGELSVSGVSNHYNLTFDKKGRVVSLLKSCFAVAKLLKQNRYELISVHTTLAAGICRLALIMAGKRKTILIYTCHGYLYSMHSGIRKALGVLCERVLAVATDAVVTMNRLDYDEAVKYRYSKHVYFTHGMGIDPARLACKSPRELQQLRSSMGIGEDATAFLCVGEFSSRKNQAMLLRAAAQVIKQRQDVYFIFAGDGALLGACRHLCSELGIDSSVFFAGQSSCVPTLIQACDIVVSASLCEGMPFNVMEGLYYGKSIAASAVRGHLDLLGACDGAVLFDPHNCNDISQKVLGLLTEQSRLPTTLTSEYLLAGCMQEYTRIYFSHIAQNNSQVEQVVISM